MSNPTGDALAAHDHVVSYVAEALWASEVEKYGFDAVWCDQPRFIQQDWEYQARAAIAAYTKAMRPVDDDGDRQRSHALEVKS